MKKLEEKVKNVKMKDVSKNQFLENIKAYIRDCKYWVDHQDYVKAWEAISFAWGLFEAGEYLEAFEKQ